MSHLFLLRHGEVASHRGDVPLTEAGRAHAKWCGEALAAAVSGPATVLFGGTRRSRETAEGIVAGMGGRSVVAGPFDAFALRNPDLYVGGLRVEMVNTAAALADQVTGMTEDQAAAHPWFSGFFAASDPVGWWLGHDKPPGEGPDAVWSRIRAFACSLEGAGPLHGRSVVGVTHSPVLRSLFRGWGGHDPGPPPYLSGAALHVTASRIESIETFAP